MTVKLRPYSSLQDFIRVGDFLTKTYLPWQTPNWLPARWEYMHFQPDLDLLHIGRIGIWEDNGEIVGVVHFENRLGNAYFEVHPEYTHLKSEMLRYAEENLVGTKATGERQLRLTINEFDSELSTLAEAKGYQQQFVEESDWESFYKINGPVEVPSLPEGFQLLSLSEENDLRKVDRCLRRGFSHPVELGGDLSARRLRQSAPHFDLNLNIVVKAPNGDYVSYSGIWYDQNTRVAYVEPVATDPDYRRMGLGKAAVLECVRRCAERGATVANVGSGQPFYEAIGFRKSWAAHIWRKNF